MDKAIKLNLFSSQHCFLAFFFSNKMKCNCDYVLHCNTLEPHYDNCATVWETSHPGKEYPKNEDGTIRLPNKNLDKLESDVLYHLGLDTKNYDLPALFGDVKFVCIGGTKHRMREFAEFVSFNVFHGKNMKLVNLTKHSHRYATYKVGPVLSVSHGIGIPSMTTALQEIIKLLHYAKAVDPIVFRIGTSGGLGIPPGSVVVSSWGLNGYLEKSYDIPVMGRSLKLPAILDKRLSQEIYSMASEEDEFQTYLGGTMGADDFYRGQARLDGPFCDHTEEDKLEFLEKLSEMGVRNIEMEAPAFAALTKEAGIRGAIVCVTLINRLEGDQVSTEKGTLLQWQKRPMAIVAKFISKYLDSMNGWK